MNVNGNDRVNIRGVAYTLDESAMHVTVLAAMQAAESQRAHYDELDRWLAEEVSQRLWQGICWTVALFLGVPFLTVCWGAAGYYLVDNAPDGWWQFLLVIEVGALGLWTTIEVFARAAYGDDDAVGDTNSFSEAFQLLVTANVGITFMPLVATARCIGMLIRTWRSTRVADAKDAAQKVYNNLMSTRMRAAHLLDEAIPILNALAVITDTSPAVQRLVPPGRSFDGVPMRQRVEKRDYLWKIVEDMRTFLLTGIGSIGSTESQAVAEWTHAIDLARKAIGGVEHQRTTQQVLADIKEGK